MVVKDVVETIFSSLLGTFDSDKSGESKATKNEEFHAPADRQYQNMYV